MLIYRKAGQFHFFYLIIVCSVQTIAMRLNTTMNAKFLVSAVALIAVAATPAMARNDHAKADRHQTTRTGIEVMSPLVAEPGEKALAAVPPSYVGRAYWDAVRRDADRQLNRGY